MKLTSIAVRSFVPKSRNEKLNNKEKSIFSVPLATDTFVKNVSFSSFVLIEDRLEKLFDETYSETINDMSKTNPIINDLAITKPKLQFEDNNNLKNIGGYSFSDNSLKISRNIFDSCEYALISRDRDGNVENYLGVCSKKNKTTSILQARKKWKNVEAIKLTLEEKNIYIKSVIAHELRHFIQQHIIASTKNCSKIQRESMQKLNLNIIAQIDKIKEKYLSGVANIGTNINVHLLNELMSYCDNYMPNVEFDENLAIKYSSFSDDNKYWSVKEHFLESLVIFCEKNLGDNNLDSYYQSSLEIDAYNYQYEYLVKQIPKNKNVREEVVLSLAVPVLINRNKGLELMDKNGISFKTSL